MNSDIRFVELWYDRRSRNWVAQARNVEGYEVESQYSGTLLDALAGAKAYGVPVVRTNPFGDRMKGKPL